jgi:hypothetical protein
MPFSAATGATEAAYDDGAKLVVRQTVAIAVYHRKPDFDFIVSPVWMPFVQKNLYQRKRVRAPCPCRLLPLFL